MGQQPRTANDFGVMELAKMLRSAVFRDVIGFASLHVKSAARRSGHERDRAPFDEVDEFVDAPERQDAVGPITFGYHKFAIRSFVN